MQSITMPTRHLASDKTSSQILSPRHTSNDNLHIRFTAMVTSLKCPSVDFGLPSHQNILPSSYHYLCIYYKILNAQDQTWLTSVASGPTVQVLRPVPVHNSNDSVFADLASPKSSTARSAVRPIKRTKTTLAYYGAARGALTRFTKCKYSTRR